MIKFRDDEHLQSASREELIDALKSWEVDYVSYKNNLATAKNTIYEVADIVYGLINANVITDEDTIKELVEHLDIEIERKHILSFTAEIEVEVDLAVGKGDELSSYDIDINRVAVFGGTYETYDVSIENINVRLA